MRGHLQRRGSDAWRLKVYVGRSAEGRKRYVERTIRGTKSEAERELARLIVEADEGRHVAASPMSFGALLDEWLTVKRTIRIRRRGLRIRGRGFEALRALNSPGQGTDQGSETAPSSSLAIPMAITDGLYAVPFGLTRAPAKLVNRARQRPPLSPRR
jgi:hypothetical protein